MSLSNPLRSEFSLKKTVMIIFIAIILICLITITGYYYQKTSQEIDERFIQELNQTEIHLKSASEQITKGQMLWEATYRQPLLDVASRVLEEYERSSHIPSKMNLKEVLNQTDPSYRSRIDIMLINASGVAEYSTSSKELYLDFSQWQPFFQTLTDMRMNNSFRLDRAVRGFDTTNPWRIFGYQPTPDHQYLIQITYRIYDDFNTERSKLSLHDLVTRLINQHPNVLALDLIGSTGMIISEVDEIPVLADPIDKEIAQDVYRTHESRDYIDEENQTITRFFFIESGDDESPASAYIDHVAKIVFSTKKAHREKAHLQNMVLSLLLVSIILAITLAYLFSRIIFSPVDALLEDLNEITKGNLDHTVRPSRHHEINRIINAVTQMVESLKYSIRSLESSERRYHSLFSSSLDAIILWNGNEIVHANPAAYRLFGWEQTNSKINAPSHEMIRYLLSRNRDTMHEWSDTVSIPKTGKRTLNIRIVSITLDAIPMDLIQIRDITEETRLHEEIHRLADIVRNTQSGIIAGPIHAPHIVNDAYTRLHGFTYDEAVEMGFFGPIHPDYQQDVPVWIRTAKESGHVTGQAPRIRKNGTEFPALHDLTIMKDSDNEPYLILNVQDISEHIRVWRLMLEKEALSDSLSLLSSILDNLPDPTFVIDTHGSVLAWNKAMNILSPIPREEIIAGNVSYAEAIYHKNRPMLIDKVIQPDLDITPYYYGNMKAENGIYSAEVCYQEQNGGVGYRWVLAGPLFDSKGEMIGAIETVRDITELKEAITKQSELANKLMLLSSLTRHDIRNKVTIIDGFRYFAESETDEPKVREYLNLQKRAIHDIGRLIEFTKAYQEIGIHEPAWHNVNELFERAVREVSHDLIPKSSEQSIEIYADSLIYLVFYNFVENSFRHGDHVTTVKVHGKICEHNGVLVYEDDGQGIPEEEKEKIFLRGYGKNTGLGLFLIKEILAITGITIVENGIYGMGARFEMKVPFTCFKIREI